MSLSWRHHFKGSSQIFIHEFFIPKFPSNLSNELSTDRTVHRYFIVATYFRFFPTHPLNVRVRIVINAALFRRTLLVFTIPWRLSDWALSSKYSAECNQKPAGLGRYRGAWSKDCNSSQCFYFFNWYYCTPVIIKNIGIFILGFKLTRVF